MLQNLLKKVAHGVSAILASHEVDLITRMEVCEGVVTEMETMFTMLRVSILYVLLFLCIFSPGENVATSVIQSFILAMASAGLT